ncbi:MAG TPA: MBL fold metallo-hydrolase [Kofleriaceae bacterium]|nr:MBL fold metallo-hydrolase [Kofleriaceae bacterium]
MDITFWGVRGSYPVPGAATVRYGGQTSCVEVRTASGESLIVDAGTGLRALGQRLAREHGGKPREHHILLSHVHWDHIQGLPFFEPAYVPGTQISVYASLAAADELKPVIGGITRHEFFPMPLESVPAHFEFQEVEPGASFCIGAFEIMPIALNHPFGAVGYRITADGTTVAYVSDTAPFDLVLHKRHFLSGLEPLTDDDRAALGAMKASLVDALRGVDTVVYDTHFLPHEYEKFPHYGHSTPEHGIEICKESGARCLVLYHHAPSHDDDMMDDLAARYAKTGEDQGLEIVTAREGMVLAIGAPA